MILEDATKEAFNYYSYTLTLQSAKSILVACTLCGEFRILRRNGYRTFCNSCSHILGEANKGKIVSEEIKRKISESKKGNKNPNYGKTTSDETKRKMSEANKGKKHTDEAKQRMSKAQKGILCAEETKQKISKSLKGDKKPGYGKPRSKEVRQKISEGNKGKTLTKEHRRHISENHADTTLKNNPNWRDGISFEPYCIKFNDKYKKGIRVLFGNECFLCGKTTEDNGQALSVHHVNYNKGVGCDDTDIVCVPLCRRCHSKTGGDRDYWQALIMEMLKPLEAWE